MGFLTSLFDAIVSPTKENKNALKGASGEAQASFGMFLFLPKEYRVINNVTLETPKGTTQIDHVVVSSFGIHVVEIKNIKGAIYGDEASPKWTVFLGGKKFPMHSPILQNKGHIKALSSILNLDQSVFHSLIFFMSSECKFKTEMPDYVRTDGLCTFIKSKTVVVFTESQVECLVEKLMAARLVDSKETHKAHVENIKERFHTKHKAGDNCPRCESGKLLERSKKDGSGSFLGCSAFPKCRHIEGV